MDKRTCLFAIVIHGKDNEPTRIVFCETEEQATHVLRIEEKVMKLPYGRTCYIVRKIIFSKED